MDLGSQYEFVKSSRSVLLAYCSTFSAQHFVQEVSSFGRGSVRNLLVHIGNTYEFWIGSQALQKQIPYKSYQEVTTIQAAADYLATVDVLMKDFINCFAGNYMADLETSIAGKPVRASPLKLFSHVITHEFHHKGQILSLSRHLGYLPVDTDIIR